MIKIFEIREIEMDNIKNIIHFIFEPDADDYITKCKNICIKKHFYVLEKGEKYEDMKKKLLIESALSKLTDEEKIILGLK